MRKGGKLSLASIRNSCQIDKQQLAAVSAGSALGLVRSGVVSAAMSKQNARAEQTRSRNLRRRREGCSYALTCTSSCILPWGVDTADIAKFGCEAAAAHALRAQGQGARLHDNSCQDAPGESIRQ